MVTFRTVDIFIIFLFFAGVIAAGILSLRKGKEEGENYFLNGRKLGLTLFVLTNVSTWYGGVLGVGEFTYNYGILSWVTQGLPYYLFAIIFAFFFAGKIRSSEVISIPDKIQAVYGRTAALVSSVLIFILVSPAPYMLMTGYIVSLIFQIPVWTGMMLTAVVTAAYIIAGGYKADVFTDVFEFFVMFAGFIVIVVVSYNMYGGFDYLQANLPATHLEFTGGASPGFLIVWFLIALWTFADPGFHQRCSAAKSKGIAVKGILVSVVFWALFDFLTTSAGLYARASIPDIDNSVLSYPLYAEKILAPGWKGIFYAGMLATILSTLNSFLFLSGMTYGRDILGRMKNTMHNSVKYTRYGIIISVVISFILSVTVESVVQMWYSIGNICIPGIILMVVGAYYEKLKISGNKAVAELVTVTSVSLIWLVLLNFKQLPEDLVIIEPMIAGLSAGIVFRGIGIILERRYF